MPTLFPRDAALNLPPRWYSWRLQQLAVGFTRSGSYERAQEFVRAAMSASVAAEEAILHVISVVAHQNGDSRLTIGLAAAGPRPGLPRFARQTASV